MVERFFRDLASQQLRRGVFTRVPELVETINASIAQCNHSPKPFIWTAASCDILEKGGVSISA